MEDITFINVIDAVLEFDTGSFENTFNNVWALKSHDNCVDMNGNSEAVFNFCVFGWSAADAVNLGDQSLGIFTNCDIFPGSSDVVERGRSGRSLPELHLLCRTGFQRYRSEWIHDHSKLCRLGPV